MGEELLVVAVKTRYICIDSRADALFVIITDWSEVAL